MISGGTLLLIIVSAAFLLGMYFNEKSNSDFQDRIRERERQERESRERARRIQEQIERERRAREEAQD